MAPGGGHGSGLEVEALIAQRRLELAGKPGLAGLIANGKTFSIAVFASLGGLVYGYNQGMFGQILSMNSFARASGVAGISNPTLSGLITSILELGAWVGVLVNGILADAIGRKLCVLVASVVFCVGVVVQASTHGGSFEYILAGRFVTGIGVGSLSMIVPLYNAELAPPEIRGSLVALQQLAITFGILISYWITYGTNFIGGHGDTQKRSAWLIPITIQLIPAVILGIGIMFMPQSPRWLVNQGRDEETRSVIAHLRRLPPESNLVEIEYLEIKAQRLFEQRVSQRDHPTLQDRSLSSRIKLGLRGYMSLFTNSGNFRRTAVAVLIMTFQQWTGVNFILYYAPFIFQRLGLDVTTTSLLASGVVGIVMFLATIPAVLYVDKWGRKPTLIVGAIVMGICHFIVAGIIALCENDWPAHRAAGWAAVVFIWIFSVGFGFSWGPCAWIVVAEVFPLGLRAKGISIGASSNWLNNFAVGMSTPDFVTAASYGVYIFLGLMCVLGALYVALVVPETKGRTLDEMDELFGDKTGRNKTDAELLYDCMREVGLLRAAGVEKSASNSSKEEKIDDAVHYEHPNPAAQAA
jgi:sugar porter (SP) family MFS transporter